jgi:hypothetical protein
MRAGGNWEDVRTGLADQEEDRRVGHLKGERDE